VGVPRDYVLALCSRDELEQSEALVALG